MRGANPHEPVTSKEYTEIVDVISSIASLASMRMAYFTPLLQRLLNLRGEGMLLYEGVEAYKKEGPKFIQRLVAKQKLRTK